MGKTIAQKIIAAHLVSGDMTVGSEVALRIDQTLTQDATGTMAYLEFETMGIPRVKTELSIAYVDHNTLQCGFENGDDHRYLQTVTASTVSTSPVPATASATRYTWNGSVSPARPSSVLTATPPPAAVSACWPSVQAVWTWLWPWAAALTTSPCPRCSR